LGLIFNARSIRPIRTRKFSLVLTQSRVVSVAVMVTHV